MTLTKNDLSAIGKVVDISVGTKVKPLANKIDKLDKKFDKLFDFLDKDLSKTKREVREIQEHFSLPVVTI